MMLTSTNAERTTRIIMRVTSVVIALLFLAILIAAVEASSEAKLRLIALGEGAAFVAYQLNVEFRKTRIETPRPFPEQSSRPRKKA